MSETKFRLKQLRGKITQDKFAASIGVHRNTWARWEAGQGEPDLSTLAVISQKMGISLDWLILGSGTMHNNREYHLHNNAQVDINEETGDMSPVSSQQLKQQHIELIDNPKNNVKENNQKSGDMSPLFDLQNEIIELLKKQNNLTEQNADLRIRLNQAERRIKELEEENEKLRNEFSRKG